MYIRVKASSTPKEAFLVSFTSLLSKNTKIAKIFSVENQSVTKKVHFFLHFFAKIFGQFKNLLYLCIRFRSKMGHAPKEHKHMIFEKMSIHNKIVVQELSKL